MGEMIKTGKETYVIPNEIFEKMFEGNKKFREEVKKAIGECLDKVIEDENHENKL